MVISVRISPEQEAKYRSYAQEHNQSLSEFMRESADEVIRQAESILEEAEKERIHEEEFADFKKRFEEFKRECTAAPTKYFTDEEIYQMRLERYGLA